MPERLPCKFNFDALNRETAFTPPDIGLPSDGTSMTYSPDGNTLTITRPDGKIITNTYDSGGRLARTESPDAALDVAYQPGTGRIASVTRTNPDGSAQTTGYSYDGSMLTAKAESGAVAYSAALAYNNNFWTTSQAVNGSAINYTYDNDGLITGAGALSIARNAQNGVVTGSTLGVVTDSFTYSMFGDVTAHEAKVNGAVVYRVDYVRDRLGRITKKTEAISGVTTILEYSYDGAGRLSTVKENGVTVAEYTYGANGNRVAAITRAGSFSGQYDAQDRLLTYGVATYTYTANGELLTKTNSAGTTTYKYDVTGQLLRVNLPDGRVIEYVIDSTGRKIGKKVDGVLTQGFVYLDKLNPVAELDGAGNVVARFVHGYMDGSPAYIVKGGETFRVIADNLSGPRLVINTVTGQIVQRLNYDEYGNVLADTNPGFTPFGFGAGLYDQDTKLLRFGARDYDSFAGRWTAKDPALFNYGEFNVYGYVKNNPVNRIDPTGLDPSVTGDCCKNNDKVSEDIKKACKKYVPYIYGYYLWRGELHDCLKEKCDSGVIGCANCKSSLHKDVREKDLGLTNSILRKPFICAEKTPLSVAGSVTIHEWAHDCGWAHEDNVNSNTQVPGEYGGPMHPMEPNDLGPLCPSCTSKLPLGY